MFIDFIRARPDKKRIREFHERERRVQLEKERKRFKQSVEKPMKTFVLDTIGPLKNVTVNPYEYMKMNPRRETEEAKVIFITLEFPQPVNVQKVREKIFGFFGDLRCES